VIVATSSEAAIYNGSKWSAATHISDRLLTSVSCTSESFCIASDEEGRVVTYNGASWSTPVQVMGESIASVSCASESFCAAVGLEGEAAIYSGKAWGASTRVESGPTFWPGSVSCVGSRCVAVDTNGHAITYDGSWSAPVSIEKSGSSEIGPVGILTGVSCQSESFCVAVDDQGNVLKYPASKAEIEAERKAEEEAAAKRQAEDETAAKKHHEEEATTANKQGEEAAAAKKREAEAAAKKKAEDNAATNASIRIVKLRATKRGVLITIDSSQAGTVIITGPGLKRTVRVLSTGTHKLAVAFNRAGITARRTHRRIKVTVTLKVAGRLVTGSGRVRL
jgi:hypothetical protein